MVFIAYARPFIVGGIFGWWVLFAFFGVVGLWFFWVMKRFAHNRNAVMEQTGEKWYRYACSEIFSERGRGFLRQHFAETFVPERVRFKNERPLAQAAALGVYLRLLEEGGKDATHYDTLPVDHDAVQQARVRSRIAIPSFIYKDVV